jgi:hypothetical protein
MKRKLVVKPPNIINNRVRKETSKKGQLGGYPEGPERFPEGP